MEEQQIRKIVSETLKNQILNKEVINNKNAFLPVEVNIEASGHHVHLSQSVLEELFGKGYQLTEEKPLSQPGQFMCKERVTVIGEKGQIERVAVLGPVREKCQIELSKTDCIILGIEPPVAMSGELSNGKDLFLKNGNKIVKAEKAAIIPQNHVHISDSEAKPLGLLACTHVDVFLNTERPVTFHNVPLRISANASFVMHLDYDEANACGLLKGQIGVMKPKGSSANTPSYGKDIRLNVRDVTDSSSENIITCDLKLLSEAGARDFVNNKVECLQIKKKTIITPGAKDILKSGNVKLEYLIEKAEVRNNAHL